MCCLEINPAAAVCQEMEYKTLRVCCSSRHVFSDGWLDLYVKQEHASNLNFVHSMGDDEDIEQLSIFNFKLEQLCGRAANI